MIVCLVFLLTTMYLFFSAGPFRDSSDWKRIGVTDNCQHLGVYLSRQRGDSTLDQTEIKVNTLIGIMS